MNCSNIENQVPHLCFLFVITFIFFLHGATTASGPAPAHYWGFTITLRHATLGMTHLDIGSTNTETSTWRDTTIRRDRIHSPTVFEPTILASERPLTHALDCPTNGIGFLFLYALTISSSSSSSCSWRVRCVSCSLILKMKLVPPSLPRSSYVPSSFWFIL